MSLGFQPLLIGILGWICFIFFFVLIETLFPKIIREGKEIVDDSLGRAFWLGLVNGVFLLALTLLFFYLANSLGFQVIALPGIIFALIFLVGGIIGLSIVFQLVGDRLFPGHSTFRKGSYAAGVTILACLTPFIGWYGLFPFVLFVGFGSFVIRAYNQYRSLRKKSQEKSK